MSARSADSLGSGTIPAADAPAPGGRGLFLSLEGLEGVGKTTNREFVLDCLREHAMPVVVSREPGGTELGESLRNLILSEQGTMQAATELLLVMASRLEHIADVIEPALAAGRSVVCDRFIDASYAYQGAGRELGSSLVCGLHELLGVSLQPDLTLLLDMPPADGLARTRQRAESPDRIEREAAAFFERARAAYLSRATADPDRIHVIDASQPLETVQQDIRAALTPLLTAHAAARGSNPVSQADWRTASASGSAAKAAAGTDKGSDTADG